MPADSELHQHQRQGLTLLTGVRHLREQNVNAAARLQQSRLLIGHSERLHQAAQTRIGDGESHLLGNGLEHYDICGVLSAAARRIAP